MMINQIKSILRIAKKLPSTKKRLTCSLMDLVLKTSK